MADSKISPKIIRAQYPSGTRIRLLHMEDPYDLSTGSTGTVDYIDDIGSIHVRWDSGSSLALIPGVDDFQII